MRKDAGVSVAYTEKDVGVLPTTCGGDSENHNWQAIRRNLMLLVPVINNYDKWHDYPAALQGVEMIRGDLLTDLTEGGSADITEVHTGSPVTVYDDLLATGQVVLAGTRVHAEFDLQDGLYWVGSAKCP